MMAIGGVVGGGLFLGSGAVINSAGPSAVFSYALVGLFMVFIMRMLGEMSTVYPSSGSFSTYAHNEIGPWAGYTIGWLYLFYWIVVIAIESMMAAIIIHEWVPFMPVGIISFICIALLTLTNIFSAKLFGEFEYWFSIIKVVAIIAFLIIGTAMIMGLFPHIEKPGTSNLLDRGGLMPNGPSSLLLAISVVIFAFPGMEIATIAAGESPNPQKAVMAAINSVIWRVLIFYIGSVTILVTLLPWDSSSVLKSPFVTVLDMLGVPGASLIMNIIILVAVLSVLNTGIYTTSRMLYSLAEKGDAPKVFLRVTKKGSPIWAVLGCTGFSLITLLSSTVSPDKLYLLLINATACIALIVYLFVAISHVRMRNRLERDNPDALIVRMWLFPYLTYFVIISMAALVIAMAFIETTRLQLIATIVTTVIVLISYPLTKIKNKDSDQSNNDEESYTALK
ncbi:GABA permease [Priestia aryabhattai]|uniref:amino acid permease n=1 Tax=Priestia aryabhattai TaxID=412384 RepID=UPI000B5008EB|nr:GABA permease [Priestia aryabhattai]